MRFSSLDKSYYQQWCSYRLRSKGYYGTPARDLIALMAADRADKVQPYATSVRDAAYGMGFLPADVSRMGVTPENKGQFISRLDYVYLHPLNGEYDKWLADRISARNVFPAWRDRMEECFFHIILRDNQPFIIALCDTAKQVEPTFEGIYELLAKEGPLAISSARWSALDRWTIEAIPGWAAAEGAEDAADAAAFLLNGVAFTVDQLRRWVKAYLSFMTPQKAGAMVVFRPVVEAGTFQQMAPGANVRLQVLMLNADGLHPQAAQAQLRVRKASDKGGIAPVFDRKRQEGQDPALKRGLPLGIWNKPALQDEYWATVSTQTGAYQGLRQGTYEGVEQLGAFPGVSQPFAGSIPQWDAVCTELQRLCRNVPQIEFGAFEVAFVEGGFVITHMDPYPPFNNVVPFNGTITAFFKKRYAEKEQVWNAPGMYGKRLRRNMFLKLRNMYAEAFFPKGLVKYQAQKWPEDIRADKKSSNGVPRAKKKWAYKHGFLSYRLEQYGITEDNWKNYISDFEYRWIRHINCDYKYWLEDKITLKYICSEFSECFPAYYYYICSKDGKNLVIPMMDAPQGFDPKAEDVLRLAREVGVLALKPDQGSHGEGFYKLTYAEGEGYCLNGKPASEEKIVGILEDPENQYLVTEYIQMHPQLAEIYPGSVNTIRVTVFKRDGRTAQVGNVYARFGTSSTGAVDNVAAGGIVAEVDIETGRYGNAKRLDGVDQGNMIACPVHPDTGVAIEGVFPHWQECKEKILAIAESIPQLEYFGFDLAITPDGIKLPEINRYPDFPRVDVLTPEIIEYLLYKLECKKRAFGYHKKPCNKRYGLPAR